MQNIEVDVCARLKEERERLGLTQQKVAEICGVGVATVYRWEKTSAPAAHKLATLHPHNFDLLFILTGTREGAKLSNEMYAPKTQSFEEDESGGLDRVADFLSKLSNEEAQWLLWFRAMSEQDKFIATPMIKGFAERKLNQQQDVG